MPMTCPHRATPLQLPDGTKIVASGCFDRTTDDEVPTSGCTSTKAGDRPGRPSSSTGSISAFPWTRAGHPGSSWKPSIEFAAVR